jgi:hypothetical protein
MNGDFVYCNNVQGLMEELQLEHTPEQWRLLVDSSKVSLTVVLLHNGKKYPSVPRAHAVHMKEIYKNLQVLQQTIHYEEHRRNICADLKVIAMLTGLEGGYTKFCCFLCDRAAERGTTTIA